MENENFNLDLDDFLRNSDLENVKKYESLCQAFPDIEPYIILEFMVSSEDASIIDNLILLSSEMEEKKKKNVFHDLKTMKFPIIYPQEIINNTNTKNIKFKNIKLKNNKLKNIKLKNNK